MKILLKVNLAVLVLLAISSAVTKILLLPQDVEFFGKYGFSDPILVAYGATQLIGGTMMIVKNTRYAGAAIVAITFLISALLLIMDGNISVATITFIAMFMLGVVMKQSLMKEKVA